MLFHFLRSTLREETMLRCGQLPNQVELEFEDKKTRVLRVVFRQHSPDATVVISLPSRAPQGLSAHVSFRADAVNLSVGNAVGQTLSFVRYSLRIGELNCIDIFTNEEVLKVLLNGVDAEGATLRCAFSGTPARAVVKVDDAALLHVSAEHEEATLPLWAFCLRRRHETVMRWMSVLLQLYNALPRHLRVIDKATALSGTSAGEDEETMARKLTKTILDIRACEQQLRPHLGTGDATFTAINSRLLSSLAALTSKRDGLTDLFSCETAIHYQEAGWAAEHRDELIAAGGDSLALTSIPSVASTQSIPQLAHAMLQKTGRRWVSIGLLGDKNRKLATLFAWRPLSHMLAIESRVSGGEVQVRQSLRWAKIAHRDGKVRYVGAASEALPCDQ